MSVMDNNGVGEPTMTTLLYIGTDYEIDRRTIWSIIRFFDFPALKRGVEFLPLIL